MAQTGPSRGRRHFNVFGSRQHPLSQYAAVIPNFITALLAGEQPVVYGDGEQSRDFTYVGNVVEASLLAMTADGVAGKLFDVAAGERTTLNQLLDHLGALIGRAPDARYEPARPGDVRHSQADIGRAHRELGYGASISLEEGLRRTLAWYAGRAPTAVPAS